MTMQVLFNGQVLVRPGAYTKIDASQFSNTALNGLGIVGLIGEADGGQPHTVNSFFASQDVKSFYLSGDLVEAANMAANPSNDPRIPSGAQLIVCYKVNNSTKSSLTTAPFVFSSLQYGVAMNSISMAISAGGGGFVVTISTLDAFNNLVQEVSPTLGSVGKFSIQYTGTGAAATLTTSATQLVIAVTAPGVADGLTLNYADYPILSQLLQAISVTGKYTVAALVTNTNSVATNTLDQVTAIDIKTAVTSIFTKNADVANWVNTNSQIIGATFTLNAVPYVGPLVQTSLTGGTRGTSANSDWVTGFTALSTTRINQMIPLASADATTAQGTFTIVSILAALVAYAKQASSTAGQNEVQGWAGISGTKTAIITAANLQNSEHLQLFGEKSKLARTSDGAVVFFPEWSTAVVAAGMRAGAPLGEPLTWKYANVLGVSSDASWSETNNSDVVALTLNGVDVLNTINGRGFRFDKMVTTFTKLNNDAYTEETIVQIWKLVAYNLRQALQDAFVGRGGTLQRVGTVPGVVAAVMQPLKDVGAITDSVVNGTRLNAWRNVVFALNGDTMTVSVTVTPTPGINYVLTTIVLVPAQITSAAA